jgi:hypothetical protein
MKMLDEYKQEISKKVGKLMKIHYGDIPDYIDKKKFNTKFKKVILDSIPGTIAKEITERRYRGYDLLDSGRFRMYVHGPLLAFPFISPQWTQIDMFQSDGETNVEETEIIFSRKLSKYILELVESEKDCDKITEIMKILI